MNINDLWPSGQLNVVGLPRPTKAAVNLILFQLRQPDPEQAVYREAD